MKRTTLSLPDELVAVMDREARRRAMSRSQIAREALESRFGAGGQGGRRRLPFVAIGRSGGTEDLGRDHEEIMAREWTDPRDS